MSFMRRLAWTLPAMALVPMLSGCASLSARSKAPDLPAMNVPPPPPRVIEPAPEPLPEPVAELPAAPPSSTSTRNARPPAPRPTPQESKPPETKPAEPQAPPQQDPPPVQPAPIPPAAQLRTPQTADTSNAEKGVRATLDRARGLLQNVDYRLLNSERKKAYDDSNRFIKESEEKLKEGNFVYAQAVANKAETLARELAGK
jgi:outer membrane biosynthesis protein TonB